MRAIRNCELRKRCPQSWDSLIATEDPTIRYCTVCKKAILYCRNSEELHVAIVQNYCVAVEVYPWVQALPAFWEAESTGG